MAQHRRLIKALPPQLLDHCTVCLEEKLYSQALSLLASTLTSGSSTNAPVYLPPHQHLALVATLTVHPNLTTRTQDQDLQRAADDAIKYLRCVIRLVDVKESGLCESFSLGGSKRDRTRKPRAQTPNASEASDDKSDKIRDIGSAYADKLSLWNNSEDFWALVGWAFNCSVQHPARWERWRALLEIILDVLEADLEATYDAQLPEEEVDLGDTLLARYLSTVGHGRNNKRRVMRAVTADGSSMSMNEFGEIWRNEAKPPKKRKDRAAEDDPAAKRQKLDLDNGEFGDYFDDQSEEEKDDGRKHRSKTVPARHSKHAASDDEKDAIGNLQSPDSIEAFGGMDSIRLRQRILALLTRFSHIAPNLFTNTEELFELFTEFLRPLPLAVYQQFVMPLKAYLDENSHASLTETMFQPLLGSRALPGPISQEEFQESLAPHAAMNTTAIDNAKVSLLTESMLRALWRSKLLTGDRKTLKVKLEQGIVARDEKIASDGRKKVGKKAEHDEEARVALQCSSERMRVLIETIAC